jgi:hypothetical protein
MAPPRSPDPRMPVTQRQFAQEVAERKKKDAEHELSEARLRKQNKALATFGLINVDVDKKATSLGNAATRIGTAYSKAAGNHKTALAKMTEIQAMETQLMFSILTVVTSGALSWTTALVRLQGAAQAAGRMEGIVALEALRAQVPRDYQGAMVALAQRMKDQLSRQVSARELFTTVLEDTSAAGVGEIFGSMGPYYGAPAPSVPASQEPDQFQNSLVLQIGRVKDKALSFLHDMITKIKDLPEPEWDKYDDREFTSAYQDWTKEAGGLADEHDLPDDQTMVDDLERLIWALWIPRLHTTPKETRCGWWTCDEVPVDVYARVYKPVDDSFVRLRILTQDQTDLSREDEYKLLIAWGEKYLRNLKPWVVGQHQAKS